jgi:hypothetical protein
MVTISKVLARVAAGSLNYFGAQNYAVLATRLNIARLLKLDSLTKKSGVVMELAVLSGCDFCWFFDCCLALHGSIPACEVTVDSSPSG